jgi:GNAT superfamily N-acetyltransferase
LRIEIVSEATVEDWQFVHNRVIPGAPLAEYEVRERLGRNFLTVAYVGDDVVGCATVRAPDETGNVTVIARVLPEYRRRGYGEELFLDGMRLARSVGGTAIETVVLASNHDGLRFALEHGFAEVDRYLPPGDENPFITLRLRWL